jgi:hypothetical protein
MSARATTLLLESNVFLQTQCKHGLTLFVTACPCSFLAMLLTCSLKMLPKDLLARLCSQSQDIMMRAEGALARACSCSHGCSLRLFCCLLIIQPHPGLADTIGSVLCTVQVYYLEMFSMIPVWGLHSGLSSCKCDACSYAWAMAMAGQGANLDTVAALHIEPRCNVYCLFSLSLRFWRV